MRLFPINKQQAAVIKTEKRDWQQRLTRIDTRDIPHAPTELRLFVKLKNEELRIEYFLNWYRALGVKRFFLIDNGSTDETLPILHAQNDCHIFTTDELMSEAKAGTDWIEPLLDAFGKNQWCVVVDTDEMIVYPDSECKKLPELCAQLEREGSNAFHCMMIDTYPDGVIDATAYRRGDSLLEYSPYFDRDGYRINPAHEGNRTIRGGPRVRIFYPEQLDRSLKARLRRKILQTIADAPILNKIKFFKNLAPKTGPILNKVPLVKWQDGMVFAWAGHYLSGAKISQSSFGALLHFKFLGDFTRKSGDAQSLKGYYQGGEEYRRYHEKLKQQQTSFHCASTVKFENSAQLVRLGLIK